MDNFNQRLVRLAAIPAFLLLISCASAPKTTVIPRENGDYIAITTAGNESKALDAAVSESSKFCSDKGKAFVIPDAGTQSKDVDPSIKKAANAMGTVLGSVLGNVKAQATKNGLYAWDKDQLVMNFRCK